MDGWMDWLVGWMDGWMDELVGWLMIDRRLCPRQCIIVHWNSQKSDYRYNLVSRYVMVVRVREFLRRTVCDDID